MLLLSPFFLFIAACVFKIAVTTLHHEGESARWPLLLVCCFLRQGLSPDGRDYSPRCARRSGQARGAKRVRPDRQCLPETPHGRAFNHSHRVHCIADRRMRLSVSSGPCTLAEMLTRKFGLFVLRKFMLYFVWSFLKSSSCSTVLGFNLNSFVCLPPGTTDILYGREFFKVDGWNSGPRCVHSGIEVLEDPRRVFLNGGMLHLETLKAGLMMFVPLRPEPFFCPKNSQSFGGIISLAGIKKLLILLR